MYGVGKWLHTLLSDPSLGEPQDLQPMIANKKIKNKKIKKDRPELDFTDGPYAPARVHICACITVCA